MKPNAELLSLLLAYLLRTCTGPEAPPPDVDRDASISSDAGTVQAPDAAEPSTATDAPDPETYCQQPAEDDCWPCGAAAPSAMLLQFDDTCAADCAAYVDNLGGDCTGRCTSENKCQVDCPAAIECSGFDAASEDCEPQCGSGAGGRVYRYMPSCYATACDDMANADGLHPYCHGICVTTNACKIEC